MKKVIGFDLDDTLAITKSPISDRMAELLTNMLSYYNLCIISGGKFEQFEKQVISRLKATPTQLVNLHIMPTCGTRYYRFDLNKNQWIEKYAENLSSDEKKAIIEALESSAKKFGLWVEKPYGPIIEDRGSQVTYSALGQQAPAEAKYKWAHDNAEKRIEMQKDVASRLDNLEVRLGGTTSVDVTRVGIDKAYGINKLMVELSLEKKDILFIGDKMQPGGNDYPVKAIGVDSIEVRNSDDTIYILEGILAVSR